MGINDCASVEVMGLAFYFRGNHGCRINFLGNSGFGRLNVFSWTLPYHPHVIGLSMLMKSMPKNQTCTNYFFKHLKDTFK